MTSSIRLALALLFAFVAAVPSVAGSQNRAHDRDRDALLGELETAPAPGVPGRLTVFGEGAFAVLAPERDGAPRAVMAGATVGRKGHLVLFGHGGYLGLGSAEREDGRELLRRSLEWAGQGLPRSARRRVELVDAAPLAPVLAKLGFEVSLRDAPGAKPALVVLGHSHPSAQERADLAASMAGGGGLLCAATGWGWQQLNPGRDIATDLPLNLLLQPFGLAATGGSSGGDGDGAFRVAPARSAAEGDLAHAGRTLERLTAGKLADRDGAAARGVLLDAALAVPEDEPRIGAPIAALAAERLDLWRAGRATPLSPDPRDSLSVSIWTRRWERAAPDDVPAAPGIEAFPGLLPSGLELVDRSVTVPAGPRGRRSLGLWSPAGSVVRVEVAGGQVPARTAVRVGAHSDELWHKPRWERWPRISRAVPLIDGQVELATAFGGLLYLELDQALGDDLRLEVSGAVAAPLLRAGADDAELAAFRAQLEALPPAATAPWVELAGRHVILTVPADAARACADPAGAIAYWDATWEAHVALLGAPLADRPERFVFDRQISAGWMHSGYPIMAHLVSARDALDTSRLRREGDWGLFHELGHNAQDRAWTSANMGEVTCNLFSLHAMERMAGIGVGDNERGGGLLPALRAHRAAVAQGEAGFDELRGDPFAMLAPFVELQLAFGWEPFTAVFAEHRAVAADAGADPLGLGPPRGAGAARDQAVRDQWALRFSRAVGRDVSPFLRSCGWPLSESVGESLSDLDGWMPGQ
ncbi:M60 family metallopeptidase [Engelhardtia mirabilis]|uniref:Peptidase M60 domain-containing protein n=1 Tax=Engelhardtia mirabilis TaxID=2528011 RepID=A0A518BS77_9BACT|nr:hypothetical protein Pla133_49510 [Planctomycetes bacterium Pla133]QDV04155.1 hypothetical protein Pla86_49490 [Planctomycetes bacterium Pla86]